MHFVVCLKREHSTTPPPPPPLSGSSTNCTNIISYSIHPPFSPSSCAPLKEATIKVAATSASSSSKPNIVLSGYKYLCYLTIFHPSTCSQTPLEPVGAKKKCARSSLPVHRAPLQLRNGTMRYTVCHGNVHRRQN